MNGMRKALIASFLSILVLGMFPMMSYGRDGERNLGQTAQAAVAERLVEIFSRANETVYGVLLRLESSGVELSDTVWINFINATDLATEAKRLLDSGDYAEAKAKLIQASNILKRIMLEVSEEYEETETSGEKENLRLAEIKARMECLQARIGSLEEIISNAEEKGIDTSQIREAVQNIRGLMDQIRAEVEAGNLNRASEMLSVCRNRVGDLVGEVKNTIMETYRNQQVQRFLNQTQERLLKINEILNRTMEQVSQNAKHFFGSFTSAVRNMTQQGINEVKEIIRAGGNLTEALSKLDQLRMSLQQYISEAKNQAGTKVGAIVEKLNRFMAYLQALEQKISVLERRGINVSEISQMLNDAKSQIEQVKENILRGNENIDPLLQLIEDRINRMENAIKAIENKSRR
ncbi:MAG: hypothetical protein NZ952_06250 [Candidatus Bathyarchaeota archaeon]|nr:hypothetical protein [Candidatus Bathyarchaeota archaeon]